LAELYDLTRRSTYLEAAETAMGHYHEKAFKSEGLGACSSCGYYLYSDHPNDADRGVKNTNLEIGLAGIVLDHYAPQTSWYEPAIAATEYHMVEVRDFFNYSYLSLWDPHYFPGAGLWDVHNSIEAWYLLRAGEITGRQDFIDAAIQHYKAYEPHAPDIWEQRLMSCHFAPYVDAAHQVCTTWIVEHGGAASDKALGLVMRY
jgi:hypothetical protein